MKELQKHSECAKGTWWWTTGHKSPTISCPGCQKLGSLDHFVAEDGTITPSVVCPREPGCGFHDNVKLVGWTYGPRDFHS